MKVYDVINFNRELLLRLSELGIKPSDARYAGLYGEYVSMRGRGLKVTYIVAHLAAKYGVSERKVYGIAKSFGAEVPQPHSCVP